MRLKVKKLSADGIIPDRKYITDACYDIHSADGDTIIEPGRVFQIGTGLAFEIPKGCMMEVRPRSGISREGILLVNSPCTIDSGYRGELYILLAKITPGQYIIRRGDRLAQMRMVGSASLLFEEVDQLQQSDRGENGLGSTGR